MTAIDWLGLWAALQVIFLVLGIVVTVGIVVWAIFSVFVLDSLRERWRKRR